MRRSICNLLQLKKFHLKEICALQKEIHSNKDRMNH